MKTEDLKLAPKWKKSKDELWNELFSGLEETPRPKLKRLSFFKYAAAAIVLLAISVGTFAYLHKMTESVGRASQLAFSLPDGSKVKLNADSKISYKPYWWHVSRHVELKGEAFFEVEPGSRFSVKSEKNSVNVLGTSFNVFARARAYRVSCLSGKVEVAANKQRLTLTPNMQFNMHNGNWELLKNIDATQSIGWTRNKFSFVGVPLEDVVKEIERQYDIRVLPNSDLQYLYTGNFSKKEKPEEVLEIIGKPFGINFKIE